VAPSVEQLCNQALVRIGYTRRIGNIYEGTLAARAALDVFGQTRDYLIREADWDFARRANVALTLLKGPPPIGGYGPWQPWTPAYPPPGWGFEYAYPSDCLQFAAIVPPPTLYPILVPRAANWRVDDDSFSATGAAVQPYKVILANMPSALCVYRARVTNPALWTADFVETFVDALAEALVPHLAGNLQLKQAEQQTAVAVGAAAERRRG
jgi:hypothetical protein